MTAAVINLDTYRQRRQLPATAIQRSGREIIKEAIRQTLMEDFATLPISTLCAAAQEAAHVVDTGGTFAEAVEAACLVIRTGAIGSVPGSFARLLSAECAFLRKARLNVVAGVLRARGLKGFEYHQAMVIARRIVEGGGTITTALYQALGDDTPGGAA